MANHVAAHGGHGHGSVTGSEKFDHPNWTVYFGTYLALVFLLVVTVVLYYVDLQKVLPFIPGINLIVAMIVAVIKATLVVLFFMNVKGSTKLTKLWALIGFIWLLFMGGIFMDYLTRGWVNQTGWQTPPIGG